jgi:hypothetical protein
MAMQLPMVLDQIIEELVMSVGIFNFLIVFEEKLEGDQGFSPAALGYQPYRRIQQV